VNGTSQKNWRHGNFQFKTANNFFLSPVIVRSINYFLLNGVNTGAAENNIHPAGRAVSCWASMRCVSSTSQRDNYSAESASGPAPGIIVRRNPAAINGMVRM